MSKNTSRSNADQGELLWSQIVRETGWTIGFNEGQGADDPRPFLYVADIEYGEYLAARPSIDSIVDAMGDTRNRDFVRGDRFINFQELCSALSGALVDFGAAGSLHAEANRHLVAAIALAYFVRTKAYQFLLDGGNEMFNRTAMIVVRIPAADGIGGGVLRPFAVLTSGELMTSAALADAINHMLVFDREKHPDWFPSSGEIMDFRSRDRS